MLRAVPAPWLAACLLLATARGGSGGGAAAGQRAPAIVEEPPAVVSFAAAAGVRLRCAALGQPPPRLAWLGPDDRQLDDLPGHRRVFANGTLELLPAGVTSGSVVRCRAHNALGVALSRDVTLDPVADVSWEAEAVAGAVAAGGVAAVTCRATAAAALVRPAIWYRGSRVLHQDHLTPDARYLVADDTLLIRDVTQADGGEYSCLARHRLTGRARRSPPATLLVSPPGGVGAAPPGPPPRPLLAARAAAAAAGAALCLPCAGAAPDHPPPHYSWYHERDGRLQPLRPSAAAWPWAGGAALCFSRVAREHAGAWLCKAAGVRGDTTAHADLSVHDELTVTVEPAHMVVPVGGAARFNCSASDPAAALRWLHDGAAAGAGGSLLLRGAARHHRGVYQCFARRGRDSAQAAAVLELGESPPELHYTFIEQALRPGGGVSLRCAASGRPPPRLLWQRDQRPLDHARALHRYFISEETSPNGDVVSILNISSVLTDDGGRYTCRAHNDHGEAEHSARLNIYGPPSIRALGPVRVVAGANATIYCPYAGYPISAVWWRAPGGRALGAGGAGRVSAHGDELRLRPALAADAGRYACGAEPPHGPAATMDIDLQVRNPPKISPFIFSPDLTEGSSVQVLCGVSSGDKPMYFSWLKDNAPLPPDLQIEEKSLNEFSLLMFSGLSARHSGEYTCRVSNHAATVNYTAALSVKVAPTWLAEPLDAAVLVDAPLNIDCAAKGHPAPTVTWYKRLGDSVSVNPESEQWEQVGGAEWGAGVLRVANGSLRAAAATRALRGRYRCQADNGVGPPLVQLVNVTVHVPAGVSARAANVSAVAGRGAELACRARGDAPLAVRWTRAGRRLDLASYRWAVAEAVTADGLQSTLQLRAARRQDAGEYRCLAHNQFGSSELPLHLHVEEAPEPPRQLRLGGVGARWVRLTWRAAPARLRYVATYSALPALAERHDAANLTLEASAGDREDPDGHQTLSARVESLRPAVAYSLRLAAENHVGRSPPSDPLLFTTLEEAPSASPQNVRVRPVSSGELHVSWSAPPQDSWNGELLGYAVSWRELGAEGVEGGEGTDGARGGSSNELALGGLRAFARYALAVRAYNRAGAGPASPAVYATTADGVPEVPPSSVTCESVSARSLRVRWTPPMTIHAHALRGYDLHYAPLHLSSWSGPAEAAGATVRAAGGEATLQGLRPATNYSVRVQTRAAAGAGPASAPVYCATREDVPGAARAVRALAAAADVVRVSWLAPAQRAGRLTHYTLYTRELGKVGGEWSQRVESPDAGGEQEEEVWREVVGLRERTVYEFWVRAATAAGAGPPSRPVSAAPALPAAARVSSAGRAVWASAGDRVRLRCAAVGTPPLRRRWSPLPLQHSLSDDGDLLIHKVEPSMAGNYSCSVRNAAGVDVAIFALIVRGVPAPPVLRLAAAGDHELRLSWDAPADGGAALLGYTASWAPAAGGVERQAEVPAALGELTLRSLACGALYRVTLRAYNAVGASPPSRPLLARTRGDKAKPPPAKEFVWANSTTLRLNLLAWAGRCPAAGWSVALRAAAGAGSWRALPASAEAAEANDLTPGTWYEVRVLARSPAGDTSALYRAATLTGNGERIGEPTQLPEARSQPSDGAAAGAGSLLQPLLAAALAAALAALAATLLGDLNEISPYATFSMAGGEPALRASGCALHLHTFGRAESLDLAAPPPRPNLLSHSQEYGTGRDSDSESSGSPCAACEAARRPPPAPAARAVEAGGRGAGRRRRRPPSASSDRASLRTQRRAL